MKKLKKGFTLIELLAVIIVLAVVAVVAVPIVLDVIEESRDSANKTTAYNIIDAAKLYYTESSFDEEKKAAMSDEKNIYKLITMSNEIPEEGQLYINEVGKVSLSVVIDNKCYIKHFDSDLQVYDSEAEECGDYVRTDRTNPTIVLEIIGTMGENGWYKANEDGTDTLYVKINATDTESGISQYRWCEGIDCTPINTETETGKSISITDTSKTMVCVEAIDKQGNSSGVVCSQEIKKDTQAPEFSGVGDLTVEVNGIIDLEKDVEVNDVMSGLVLETKPQYTYSPENIETNQTKETEVIYEAKDKAGNIRRVTRKVIVSSEAPTITFTAAAGAINGQGWAKNDFYVTINVSDNSGYGIKSFNVCTSSTDTCDPSTGSTITGKTSEAREIVTESNNNRICVQATDNYNQTSSVICSDAYKLDKTAPTAGTIKVNGSSTINAWYTGNVTIEAVNGTDSLSDHLSTTASPLSITNETTGTTVTVTTSDKAGNTSTRNYTIRIDKSNPDASVSVSGKVATLTMTDTLGLIGYGINQSTSTQPTYTSISGTRVSKTWTASAPGTYVVWVKDNAGKTKAVSFNIAASAFNYAATSSSSTYTASAACSGGRTLSGGNCTYYYASNSDQCGSTPYDCNCWDEQCNCKDVCVGGNEQYTYTGTCTRSGSCNSTTSYGCNACSQGKANFKVTSQSSSNCDSGGNCTLKCNYTYTESCQQTGTRWNDCLTTTKSCETCRKCNTCYSPNSCTKTENQYRYYTCNSGDTLSGTTCTHITYSCPNGGTLSGTTCTF